MKSFIKTGSLFILALIMAVAAYGQERPADLVKAGDMIAGGGVLEKALDVGDLYIWRDCANIYVEFAIVDGTPEDYMDNWYITTTQVEIGLTLNSIPQRKGNPVPGQFTYKMDHDAATGYIYTIPLGDFADAQVYFAAHADVCQVGGVKAVMGALPTEPFNVRVTGYNETSSSYLATVVISNDTWLDGTHTGGWCIDVGHDITAGVVYTARAYSSYDEFLLTSDLVDYPQNLDLANWLLNENLTGATAYDEWGVPLGVYSWMDIQGALWALLDKDVTLFPQIGQNSILVAHLVELASAHEGFTPDCGDDMIIVLAITDVAGVRRQTIVITVPVPCSGACETAWGAMRIDGMWNYTFPGKNWATYLWMVIPNYCTIED